MLFGVKEKHLCPTFTLRQNSPQHLCANRSLQSANDLLLRSFLPIVQKQKAAWRHLSRVPVRPRYSAEMAESSGQGKCLSQGSIGHQRRLLPPLHSRRLRGWACSLPQSETWSCAFSLPWETPVRTGPCSTSY